MWCPDRWRALSFFLQNHFGRAVGQRRHWQQDAALGPAVDPAADDLLVADAKHEPPTNGTVHAELEPIKRAFAPDHLRHDPGERLSLDADGLCRSTLLALKIGQDCAADGAALGPAPARGLDRAEHVAGGVKGGIGAAAEIVDPRPFRSRIADKMAVGEKRCFRPELPADDDAIGLDPLAAFRAVDNDGLDLLATLDGNKARSEERRVGRE